MDFTLTLTAYVKDHDGDPDNGTEPSRHDLVYHYEPSFESVTEALRRLLDDYDATYEPNASGPLDTRSWLSATISDPEGYREDQPRYRDITLHGDPLILAGILARQNQYNVHTREPVELPSIYSTSLIRRSIAVELLPLLNPTFKTVNDTFSDACGGAQTLTWGDPAGDGAVTVHLIGESRHDTHYAVIRWATGRIIRATRIITPTRGRPDSLINLAAAATAEQDDEEN